MRLGRFSVVVLLLACGSAHGPRPLPRGLATVHAPTVPAVAPGEYVLVPRDAWLHSDVAADAPRARTDRAASLGAVWVLRARAPRGDFMTVENVTSSEASAHCYRALAALDDYRLRLLVRASDLAEVTTRRVTQRYGNGTSVTLEAGVAVRTGAAGSYAAEVDGQTVTTRLEGAAVGRSYALAARPARGGDEADWLRGGETVRLGGPGLDVVVGPEGLWVRTQTAAGADVLASVDSACAAYRVRARPEQIERAGDRAASIGSGHGSWDAPVVDVGTQVFWPDGRVAGTVLVQHRLLDPPSALTESPATLRCFRHALSAQVDNPEAVLPLCFRPEDLH